MRLRKDKGVRIKGALQTTQDPNVPKIIPVFNILSISIIHNTGNYISHNIL